MPREPRPQIVDGIYHVTARGNRRQLIFTADRDRWRFLALLDGVASRCGWRGHAFCLMPNHYHLVIETPYADISAGMHRLNSSYAHWFNWFHEVNGHLFQARFHSVVVESDWHLLELSRYVPLNPVRASLCARAADWPWSSYRAHVGEAAAPGFLAVDRVLAHFGREPTRAREAFARFVQEGLAA